MKQSVLPQFQKKLIDDSDRKHLRESETVLIVGQNDPSLNGIHKVKPGDFHDDPLPPLKVQEKPTSESLNVLMDMIAATETTPEVINKVLDKAGANDIDQLTQEQVDKWTELLRNKLKEGQNVDIY